ncbi:hypothetical protein TTHERM_000041629 (macronuclear) [Tetrahymena thermophila SB210]|uniref:Zinc carboxypeptidase family protein n=1 Tax=Tetrahymena thermophila (strain SB210) TaxID=312017 RepID=W7XC29_TETTS|nr:hypothetical protein TTHERM_000041629 [Tetrahymena thermophila SB210]EWS74917.1 hypothetical protein TTHERM_000041629 [Tetrahymena thermophila SB210]|eukprot:XP_012652630.1 hypothetical protein TTHERM_000041629 [Tetrahymena thermophila SB210]
MQKTNIQENCQKHKGQFKSILLFDQNNIQPLMCLSCAKIASKNSNNVIDVNEFIHSDEDSIFSNFPPLIDDTLYQKLDELLADQEKNFLDKCISQVQNYFYQLKAEINIKLDLQRDKIKNNIIQIFCQNDSLIHRFNNISQKKELQNLYNNYNEQSAQKIKEIVNQMYQNINQNTQQIKQKVDEIMEVLNKFRLDQPLQTKNQLIQLVEKINFFQDSLLDLNKINKQEQIITSDIRPQQKVNQIELLGFEKSKNFKNSQQIIIEKTKTNELLIRQSREGFGISYSNFIIDPKKKYVLRFEIQPLDQSNYSDFSFIAGLIQENHINSSEIDCGIRLLYQGQKSLSSSSIIESTNKNLEIRIHLQDQLFKIVSLPSYHNVYELQKKETIKENCQFRLAFLLYYTSHKFVINYFSEVNKFENDILK